MCNFDYSHPINLQLLDRNNVSSGPMTGDTNIAGDNLSTGLYNNVIIVFCKLSFGQFIFTG